jgi:hypothetical protein
MVFRMIRVLFRREALNRLKEVKLFEKILFELNMKAYREMNITRID